MPRVPDLRLPTGNYTETTGARFRAADNGGGAFGGLGEGLQSLGRAGAQMAETQDRIDLTLDTTAAKKVDREAWAEINSALNDEGGFYTQRGLNAAAAREAAEKRADEIRRQHRSALTSERQRQMFDEAWEQRWAVEQSKIIRHAVSQTEEAEISEATAGITRALDDARLNWSDEPLFRQHLQTAINEQRTVASRQGWSAEQTDAAIDAIRADAHAAVVEQMALEDPEAAMGYVEAHADKLGAKANAFRKALYEPLQHRRSLRVVDEIMGAHVEVGGVVAEADGAGPDTVDIFERMIWQESRGRQTDEAGNPITSSAGAVGIAQVMPATAPEGARLAGMAFDPVRYREDADYNRQLGEAYFMDQVRRFGGDTRRAVAAYNAGPGRVQQAVQRGGANWEAHLPAETKEYLRIVLGERAIRSGPESAPRRHNITGMMQAVDQIDDPAMRDRVRKELMSRVQRDETLLRREQAQAGEEGLEYLETLGSSFTDIGQMPADILRRASVSDRLAWRKVAERNAKGDEIQTNSDFYTQVSEAYGGATTPAKRQEFLEAFSPADARAHLDDTDYERFLAWRRKAMDGGADADVEAVRHSEIRTLVGRELERAGVTLTGKTGSKREEAAEHRSRVERRVLRAARTAEAQGQEFGAEQMLEVIDAQIREVRVDGDLVPRYEVDDIEDLETVGIPTEMVPEVDAALRASGMRVTQRNRALLYLRVTGGL